MDTLWILKSPGMFSDVYNRHRESVKIFSAFQVVVHLNPTRHTQRNIPVLQMHVRLYQHN